MTFADEMTNLIFQQSAIFALHKVNQVFASVAGASEHSAGPRGNPGCIRCARFAVATDREPSLDPSPTWHGWYPELLSQSALPKLKTSSNEKLF